MQKPGVGDQVHFNNNGHRTPATITRIHPDGKTVELTVLRTAINEEFVVEHAEHHEEAASEVEIPNNMDTTNWTWSWPPRGD